MRKAMVLVLALVLFPTLAEAQGRPGGIRLRAAEQRQNIARAQLERRLRQTEIRSRLQERRQQLPRAAIAPRVRVRPMHPSIRLRQLERNAAPRVESRRNQLESRIQRSLPRPPRPPMPAGRRLRRWA